MIRGIVCIDIGGTEIKYGLMNEEEVLCGLGKIPTEANLGGTGLKLKVSQLLEYFQSEYEVLGVAISTAGMVDPEKGTILYSGPQIPDYIGVDWKHYINEKYALPSAVENDVNCAGLAEAISGAAAKCSSVVCLTVGTGIGGAFILHGKVYHGFSGSAMEIGYLHQHHGSFQENASTTTLVERFSKRKGISPEETDGRRIFDLAKAGDGDALEEIDLLIDYLGEGIADLCYTLNPEIVVLGGGIMEQTEYLKPRILKKLKEKLLGQIYHNTEFAFALHKNHAGMIGAYYHYKQNKH